MKVLRSIISSASVSDFIYKNYNIGLIISHKLIKACGSNDIYLIQTKNQTYLAKVFSKRLCWQFTKFHFLYELKLQCFLKNQNVPVSEPLANRYQQLITEFLTPEYKKYLSLYKFIISNNEEKISFEKYFLLGNSLAKLHEEGKKFRPNIKLKRQLDIDFLIHAPLERFHKYANINSTELHKEIDILAKTLQNTLNEIGYMDFCEGNIHGDVHCGNFIFSDKKAILIDFELSGYGKIIYDLATLYWDITLFKKHQVAKNIWSNFLKGYLSSRSLLSNEIKSIRTIAQVRHFFMMGSSYILYPELTKFNNEARIKKDLTCIDKIKKSTIISKSLNRFLDH